MSEPSATPAREPLPVREPGKTLRDNPIPPPRIDLDHHAAHCFGSTTERDTIGTPAANRAF